MVPISKRFGQSTNRTENLHQKTGLENLSKWIRAFGYYHDRKFTHKWRLFLSQSKSILLALLAHLIKKVREFKFTLLFLPSLAYPWISCGWRMTHLALTRFVLGFRQKYKITKYLVGVCVGRVEDCPGGQELDMMVWRRLSHYDRG